MTRYTRGPKAPVSWIDDDSPLVPEVQVPEHIPVETGLIWADGQPIMREPNPMGFGRDEDW